MKVKESNKMCLFCFLSLVILIISRLFVFLFSHIFFENVMHLFSVWLEFLMKNRDFDQELFSHWFFFSACTLIPGDINGLLYIYTFKYGLCFQNFMIQQHFLRRIRKLNILLLVDISKGINILKMTSCIIFHCNVVMLLNRKD